MKYHKSRILIGLILLAGTWGCGEKIDPGTTQNPSGAPLKLATMNAQLSPRPALYEAVGTVTAEISSTIAANTNGIITAVRVREGQSVKAGELLLTIDQRQTAARKQQAEAALNEARQGETATAAAREAAVATAELARKTLTRYQGLHADEAVSEQEFDEIKARFAAAQAALRQADDLVLAAASRVRQAEAALAESQVFQGYARILAPYDGLVTARLVDPGELANPGRALLRLEQNQDYRVEIMLPELYIGLINLQQSVPVRIPALDNLALTATISTIDPAAAARSRSFLVKLALPANPDLRSGMFARAAIDVGRDQLFVIPASAIVVEGQLTGIFKIDEKKLAHYRLIRTGRQLDNGVEVISGLSSGDIFVLAPPATLKDGTRVESAL
ncbi:MAG: efflux RND transporter periplasmic adaptor subunit [Deltaproteobacteria bacterium]|nr:efflux RND transporter periplasmic adaptor subunit [Deltaproteobacteria bacterium]